jgi:hypothetical protein
MAQKRRVQVQLLSVPDCPLVEKVRSSLESCLHQTHFNVVVEELIGDYSSPTLLVDGFDVTGHHPTSSGQVSCRLGLPNEEEILAALHILPILNSEDEQEKQILTAAFGTLLNTGHRISISDLSTGATVDREKTSECMESMHRSGSLKLDSDQFIVAAAGLSVSPTKHEILFLDGRRFWTWCALDILGIFGALGASGSAKSYEPVEDKVIQIDFVDGVPQNANAMVFIADTTRVISICCDWCPNVNFFASRSSGEEWLQKNAVEGSLISIHNVVSAARAVWSRYITV